MSNNENLGTKNVNTVEIQGYEASNGTGDILILF